MNKKITIAIASILSVGISAIGVYAASWVDQGSSTSIMGSNVGIGTTSPDTKLQVSNSSAEMLKLMNTGMNGGIFQTKVGGGGWEDGKYMIVDRSNGQDASRLVITPAGNVGINTNNPGAKLEVNAGSVGSWSRQVNVIDTAANGNPYIFVGDGGNHGMSIGHTNAGDATSYGWLSYYGLDPTAGQGLILKSNGNVGVGTNNPLSSFAIGSGSLSDANVPMQISTGAAGTEKYMGVNKNGGYGLLMGYSNAGGALGVTGGVIRQVSSDPLYLVTNNTNIAMTALSSGNVGVGMSNPTERLQVNGNIKLSGKIVSDGDICIGTCN